MNEKEVFKSLNGTNYDDSEVNEYMNFKSLDDSKLMKITNDIKTKLAKEKLREAGVYVEKNILDDGEVIEKVIKGTDIDMLKTVTTVNLLSAGASITSDGYSFNRLIFSTNRRIIIMNTNHFNSMQGIKILNKEDIKDIDVTNKYKISYEYKRNKFKVFAIILGQLIASYLFANIVGNANFINSSLSVGALKLLVFIGLMTIFLVGYLSGRNGGPRILIELKNGDRYDLIIKNSDYEEVKKHLANKK